jgi:hypothetical protein
MEQKNYHKEQGKKTPEIDFNALTGELIFRGRSIPENAAGLYEDSYNWILEYAKNPRGTTNLRLNLEYFNSATSIWLAKIVKVLSNIRKSGYTLLIHLYFDIEDFEAMELDDLKEALGPVIEMIGSPSASIGIKIYGTNNKGEVVKESMVLL